MADVQIAHGYLRIANRVDEAISLAPFSGTQVKIIRVLIRQTWGWKQKSAQLSISEWAERCGLHYGGSFRAELAKLVAANVIAELEQPIGRAPGTFMFLKDFEAWKAPYTVQESKLITLYATRPRDRRKVPVDRQSTKPKPAPVECPNPGTQNSYGARIGGLGAREQAPTLPVTGHPKTQNELPPQDLQAPKDIERHKRHTATAIGAATDFTAFARGLTTAFNIAIEAKWGPQPLVAQIVKAHDTAEALIAEAVDLDFARAFIAERIPTLHVKPSTVKYLLNAILDGWRDRQQRAIDAEDRERHGGNGGGTGGPVSLSNLLSQHDASRDKREHDLRAEYDVARREAAIAWANEPAHQQNYREIVEAANAQFASLLDSRWGKTGRDVEIVQRCAERAGFPDFEAWSRARAPLADVPSG